MGIVLPFPHPKPKENNKEHCFRIKKSRNTIYKRRFNYDFVSKRKIVNDNLIKGEREEEGGYLERHSSINEFD